eukprot:m.724884 g.724884  ORF g.724884 m.724884 type:complete len:71 (-) comp23025_c2_seq16:177-389(-)
MGHRGYPMQNTSFSINFRQRVLSLFAASDAPTGRGGVTTLLSSLRLLMAFDRSSTVAIVNKVKVTDVKCD